MTLQARAVVVRELNRVALEDLVLPAPTAHDVVVQVSHSWISPGTEGSFIRGERLDGETPRKDGDPLPFPLVPGYQKVGLATWVGAAVTGVAVGDLVFAAMSHVPGVLFNAGGHVSPAVTPAADIWALPPGCNPLHFSGLVLAQVGYNCAMTPALAPGDAAVVLGDGLVGHWTAQVLRQRGARVLLVGRHDSRLARLSPHPDSAVLNSRTTDLVAGVRAWAPAGFQAVIDTVGALAALRRLLGLLRRGGQLVSAGFHTADSTIDIQQLRPQELSLHAPSGWTRPRMDATRDLIAMGVLDTAGLITHRFPVRDLQAAYATALHDRSALGVVLDWEYT